jgi:hypothetical protein
MKIAACLLFTGVKLEYPWGRISDIRRKRLFRL